MELFFYSTTSTKLGGYIMCLTNVHAPTQDSTLKNINELKYRLKNSKNK